MLEGKKEAVLSLYEKISLDSRHSTVKTLAEGYIANSQFSKWSMHFVHADSSIRQLLADYGFRKFTPFDMPSSVLEHIVTVLSNNGIYERKESKVTSSGLISKMKSLFIKDKTA